VQAPGTAKETVLADGLLLRSTRARRRRALSYHLMGYGTARVAPRCSSTCRRAARRTCWCRRRPVLHTIGGMTRDGVPFDVRLWTVDTTGGRLLGGEAARHGPKLLLARRRARRVVHDQGDEAGASSLLGWDASEQRELWRAPAPAAWITRQSLYPAGEGRAARSRRREHATAAGAADARRAAAAHGLPSR
jgi:hypothetical protein